MKYCLNCGQENHTDGLYCENCGGTAVTSTIDQVNTFDEAVPEEEKEEVTVFDDDKEATAVSYSPVPETPVAETQYAASPAEPASGKVIVPDEDKHSPWFGLLAFFQPIVGFALYFSYKKNYPIKAGRICLWAWVGLAARVIFNLLTDAFLIAMILYAINWGMGFINVF